MVQAICLHVETCNRTSLSKYAGDVLYAEKQHHCLSSCITFYFVPILAIDLFFYIELMKFKGKPCHASILGWLMRSVLPEIGYGEFPYFYGVL